MLAVGQFCQQPRLSDGIDKYARRSQSIGLDGEQPGFLIDKEDPLTYVGQFTEQLLQGRNIFNDP